MTPRPAVARGFAIVKLEAARDLAQEAAALWDTDEARTAASRLTDTIAELTDLNTDLTEQEKHAGTLCPGCGVPFTEHPGSCYGSAGALNT